MRALKNGIIPISVILFLVFSSQTALARSIGMDTLKPEGNDRFYITKEFVKTTSLAPKSDRHHRTLQTPSLRKQNKPSKNKVLKKIKKYFKKIRNRKRKIYADNGRQGGEDLKLLTLYLNHKAG